MFSGYNLLNLYCIVTLLFYFYPQLAAISCYECESTFPASSICLPLCSQSDQLNSTCILTRNIPLEPSGFGSLRAGHISEEPIISDAIEKNFVFGEEVVYENPSETVGWDWEYGSITYGCDTSGCNSPENINRLPNALNARIPDETLNQLLLGELDSSCYQCDICLDEDFVGTNMSNCALTPCPNYACNFVATRSSPTSTTQCNTGWHFTSGCILSRELAQVDMTLMYYILSKSTVLYQMETICLSDNCNNITTFQELKDAITVDPDLSCLINETSSTTTSTVSTTSSSSMTTTTSTVSITSSPSMATTTTSTVSTISSPSMTTTTTSTVSTTSIPSMATTTSISSGRQILINRKLFILIIVSIYITIKY